MSPFTFIFWAIAVFIAVMALFGIIVIGSDVLVELKRKFKI